MKVSICIPAYNQPILLKRCLDSINEQWFRDFEVVIVDDSTNQDIFNMLESFGLMDCEYSFRYLGNPERINAVTTWNKVLSMAEGEYVMLMHQDDWFKNVFSLQSMVEELDRDAYRLAGVFGNTGKGSINLQKDFMNLLYNNCIGTPSNLLFRNEYKFRFNTKLKWLVDVDFYVRMCRAGLKLKRMEEQTVCFGVHDAQITQSISPELKLYELGLFLETIPEKYWKNIRFYDHVWRTIRNSNIVNDYVGIPKNPFLSKLKMASNHLLYKFKSR